MAGKYSKMWFRVYQVVSRAQREIMKVVEEMCSMVAADVAPFLEELRRVYDFTYVIAPLQGDGDITKCVPCLYVEADLDVFNAVRNAILERFPEIVSEARLTFERTPKKLNGEWEW